MRLMTAKRGKPLSWVSILGVVCVALVLLTGVLQVTHTHPNGQPDHDCSLCVTAHQAAHVVVVAMPATVSRVVARKAVETFTPLPRQRFVLKLANRPPPVPSDLA
jgi:hypothetical protein